MARCFRGGPRIGLCLLLFAGCTDGDTESGGTETATATAAEASTSSSAGMTDEANTTAQDTGDTDGGASTGTTGGSEGPSFAVDVWPILDAHCSCHKDGAGMLRLNAAEAYANLVGQPSGQAPLMIVEPSSAIDSYLWHKINDTQLEVGGFGQRMPSGGLIEQEKREQIAAWIDAGAHP